MGRAPQLPVAALADHAVLRRAADALACKQDYAPAAASTYRRKRAVLNNALESAVDLDRLPMNPLTRMNRSTPKVPEAVDPSRPRRPPSRRGPAGGGGRPGRRR